MVCVDTDFLVALLRGKPDAKEYAKQLEASGEKLKTTIVTLCELFYGASLSTSQDEIRGVHELSESLDVLYLDMRSAQEFGRILALQRKKANEIPKMDSLIASICLSSGETLSTRDVHFSHVPGLKVRKW